MEPAGEILKRLVLQLLSGNILLCQWSRDGFNDRSDYAGKKERKTKVTSIYKERQNYGEKVSMCAVKKVAEKTWQCLKKSKCQL